MTITINNLTSGSDTVNTVSTTASISPTAGSRVLVACVGSHAGDGVSPEMAISGGDVTWTEMTTVAFGSRRFLYVFESSGTPTSGALTITFTLSSGTFAENMWVVDEVLGLDSGTPFGTAASNSGTGTSGSVTVSGTPDTGDVVWGVFAHTGATSDMTINAELSNEIAEIGNGTDVRRMLTAYDSTPDGTPVPGVTWSGTEDWGAIAFLVNAGAAGGLAIPIAMASYRQRWA